MLQTSRGIGLPGGMAVGKDCGIETLCSVFGDSGFRAFGGLVAGTSVSEDMSGGVGKIWWAFLSLRASRLFRPERRLIASLLRYSVAGVVCGSASRAVGLATCARVRAFNMVAENEGLALVLGKCCKTLLIARICLCL